MKTTMKIEGMHCNSCVMLLTDVLQDLPGVKDAKVTMGKAEVEHDTKTTHDDMKKAIEAEGYKVPQ
jgi:copper chaperone